MENHSPWLDFERPNFPTLSGSQKFDIAIVGGGIAGVSTLYFLLKNTNRKVVLIEKNQIACGASGHNAGFAVNSLERFTQDLINDFGERKVKNGFEELNQSWELLENIVADCKLEKINYIPGGGIVYTTVKTLFKAIDEEMADEKIGRSAWRYLVSKEHVTEETIDKKCRKYIELVPQAEILKVLKIVDKGCIGAAIPKNRNVKKARVNSAKLCFAMIEFLQKNYINRFKIFEKTK